MNPEKVVFGFFIVLALTLNFGFFVGEIENPEHHNVWELFAVVVVNLIATVLKFGDRTQMGAVLLATSLVAMLQLIAAVLVCGGNGPPYRNRPHPIRHRKHRVAHRRGYDRQCNLGGAPRYRNGDAEEVGWASPRGSGDRVPKARAKRTLSGFQWKTSSS